MMAQGIVDTITTEGRPYMANEPDQFREPQGVEAVDLEMFSRGVDVFRELHGKIPSSYMAAFFAVARKPGLGPTEYAKMMGTLQPIASRILLEIGIRSVGRTGGEGLGLVDRHVDIHNLRATRYFLTPEGHKLKAKLLEIAKECRARATKRDATV